MKRVIMLVGITMAALLYSSAYAVEVPQEAKVCAACHTFGKGEANKTGPNLFGIVGRDSSVSGGGWKWTEESLDKYLEDPQSAVKSLSKKEDAKTRMTLKTPDKEKRGAIIKFLKTLKE